MFTTFEDFQKFGKGQVNLATVAVATMTQGAQAVAAEAASYSKKSLDDSAAMMTQLFGVKTLDGAIEVQSHYAKNAYEGFVAQATKIGEIVTRIGKDVMKPVEEAVVRTQATR